MERILVIDDNPRNSSRYIQPLLRDYEVDVIMPIQTAERLMKKKQYAVVVIDIMMPTQNLEINNELETGLYFFKLRLAQQYPQQRVLFWSRLTSESYEQFFSGNIPCNVSFLHKDRNDPDHLLNKINEIIKGQ